MIKKERKMQERKKEKSIYTKTPGKVLEQLFTHVIT